MESNLFPVGSHHESSLRNLFVWASLALSLGSHRFSAPTGQDVKALMVKVGSAMTSPFVLLHRMGDMITNIGWGAKAVGKVALGAAALSTPPAMIYYNTLSPEEQAKLPEQVIQLAEDHIGTPAADALRAGQFAYDWGVPIAGQIFSAIYSIPFRIKVVGTSALVATAAYFTFRRKKGAEPAKADLAAVMKSLPSDREADVQVRSDGSITIKLPAASAG